jgi:hypothetical protein
MKFGLILLMLSWLVSKDIDYSNRIFLKEVETVFKTGAANLQKLDLPEGSEAAGQFFRIGDTEISGYAYVGRVNSCRSGGCSNDSGATADAYAEYFDYFILFDASKKVTQVRVFNYQASHGHGIMSKGWLRQFAGYDGSASLEPGKDIDSISGATISVRVITQDVTDKTKMLIAIAGL